MIADCSLNWADTLFEERDELFALVTPASSKTLGTPTSSNSATCFWEEFDDFNCGALDQSEQTLLQDLTTPVLSLEADCGDVSFGLTDFSVLDLESSAVFRKRKSDTWLESVSCIAEELLPAPTKIKRSRGAHVRNRPDVQQTERNGQEHWAKKLEELREEWELKQVGKHHISFNAQLVMRQRTRTRARLECLLRTLLLCAIA
eukprot:1906893-Rhodomonas_salina.1